MFAGASAPSYAGIVEPSGEFDHLATGFPLVGRHQLLLCETCHRDGEFKGLPKKEIPNWLAADGRTIAVHTMFFVALLAINLTVSLVARSESK